MVRLSDLDRLNLKQRDLVADALEVLEEIEAELANDPVYVEAERRLREKIAEARPQIADRDK